MARHLYRADVSWRRQGDFAANAYSRGHDWSFDGGITVPASASPSVVPLPNSVVEYFQGVIGVYAIISGMMFECPVVGGGSENATLVATGQENASLVA